MPRIIAGFAGSIPLVAPASGTRPTSDRVREAIFSALQARDAVRGARVLDLYAGSGALGLEAISRGAASAVLVDSAAGAIVALKRNAAALARAARVPPSIRIVGRPVHGVLASMGADDPDAPDLVFLDPPYDLANEVLVTELALVARVAAADGTVVVERSARTPAPSAWPSGLAPDRSRDYGDTRVHVLRVDRDRATDRERAD